MWEAAPPVGSQLSRFGFQTLPRPSSAFSPLCSVHPTPQHLPSANRGATSSGDTTLDQGLRETHRPCPEKAYGHFAKVGTRGGRRKPPPGLEWGLEGAWLLPLLLRKQREQSGRGLP